MREGIQIVDQGRVRRLIMDRPHKKNALVQEMYAALGRGLAEAAADPGLRVVVIGGAAGNFTAGNDIGEFTQNPPQEEGSPVVAFLQGLAAFPKPLIAAVEGVAVGIGTTLLLHCDLVYAAENTRFALPFVNLGLVPEAASSLLLPRLVGHQRAAELLLLGEPFGSEMAYALGLVNRVVPEGTAMAQALAVAEVLAAKPPAAVRATKALLRRAMESEVAETLALEMNLFRERLASPEAGEAFRAFLERRAADFSPFT